MPATCPRRSRSSAATSRSTSVSGAQDARAARGPWTATRPVAQRRGRRATAREPSRRSARRVRDDRRVAGVGDDEEAVLGQAVDDEVVDDRRRRARRSSSSGRGRPRAPAGRVTSAAASAVAGLGALDEQLAHVRQVEQAGALADGPVLLEDRRVLDRHQPAGEVDEPARRARRGARRAGSRAGGRPSAGVAPRSVIARRPGSGARHEQSAAWATSARSVSKVSDRRGPRRRGSSAPRSNSWSCLARSPPVGSIRK